jgi:ankyrin repeat protein
MDGDIPGLSELYEAVVTEDMARVRELVENGARVAWEPPPFDESPLHATAMKGRADVLELLIDAGGRAFLNTFSYLHEAPLTAAARNGHVDAVRVLLEADSDLDAHDESNVGNTALQEAVETVFEPVVALLLRAGANPNIRGWMQLNAVNRAEMRCAATATSQAGASSPPFATRRENFRTSRFRFPE